MTRRDWAFIIGFAAFALGLISFFLTHPNPLGYAREAGRVLGIKR